MTAADRPRLDIRRGAWQCTPCVAPAAQPNNDPRGATNARGSGHEMQWDLCRVPGTRLAGRGTWEALGKVALNGTARRWRYGDRSPGLSSAVGCASGDRVAGRIVRSGPTVGEAVEGSRRGKSGWRCGP